MIELYENDNQVLNDSIDRIVIELFRKRIEGAHTLILTGCSSLAGTTMVSIALGIAIANTHRKVLLVDCDVRKASKYKKLSENVQMGLADYLESETSEKIENIIQPTNINNLSYLPCGSCENNPTRVLCSSKMNELMDYAKEEYEYIILDLPSISIAPDSKILFDYADGIILTSAIGETTKLQIKRAKRNLLDYSDKYYGMIVNKVDGGEYNHIIKNYDYYLQDDKGEQNLKKRISKK